MSKLTYTTPAIVIGVQRIGATQYGNPTVNVALQYEDGSTEIRRISNNAGLVYAIGNREYRNEKHVFGLTKAGRISDVQRVFSGEAY